MPEPGKTLEQLRAECGAVAVCLRMPTAQASQAAFDEIERKRRLVSSWRFTGPASAPESERGWFIAVLGEESNRGVVERLARVAERRGGVRVPFDPPAMVASLRERRWQHSMQGALHRLGRASQPPSRVHYGGGAYLRRDGVMEPRVRGEG